MPESAPERPNQRTLRMASTPKQRASPMACPTPLGRNGFRYREQFGVIVMCRNETHQARTFASLRRRGFTCKVVTV